jgi:hypothetical protein
MEDPFQIVDTVFCACHEAVAQQVIKAINIEL